MHGTGRNTPHCGNSGVVMESTDLSMLCSAIEDHIKTSYTPSSTSNVGHISPNNYKQTDMIRDLCVGQFGEWPSHPNILGCV